MKWKRKKRKREGNGGEEGERRKAGARRAVRLDLCDLCAVTFPRGEARRGYVPDSSSVHPRNDWFDGLRLLTACGEDHLAIVREIYRSRPFVQEELWAAKITRALTTGLPVLTLAELQRRTGLHAPEIRRAIAWHNDRTAPGTTPP